MAAVILVSQKKTGNKKIVVDFFQVIDQYLESQGLIILDNVPRTYFYEKPVPPNTVKSWIHVIKGTKNYNMSVQGILYTPNLTKG